MTHVQGDFLETNFESEFDGIMSMLAFLHIPNKQKLFKKCIHSLKSGGKIFVEDYIKTGELTKVRFKVSEFDHLKWPQLTLNDLEWPIEPVKTDEVLLEREIYTTNLHTESELVKYLEDADFVDIKSENVTDHWKKFVNERFAAWQKPETKKRIIEVQGQESYDAQFIFFQSVTK